MGVSRNGRYPRVLVRGYAGGIDHKTKEIKFRDPYACMAKAMVAAYLAEEGFLRE